MSSAGAQQISCWLFKEMLLLDHKGTMGGRGVIVGVLPWACWVATTLPDLGLGAVPLHAACLQEAVPGRAPKAQGFLTSGV